MAARDVLFGSVPADIFRVFAGAARAFYADLLIHLSEDLFGQSGEVATRSRAVETIAEFIDRTGRLAAFEAVSEDAGSAGPSHFAIYDRLLQTGWLVEYRDRYRKVVDFEPSARLVLQALLDIRAGRARSYGGAVLNVLTLLQSVESDPAERALNVREAGLAARSFMTHLRGVAGSMRKVEALIMAQSSAAGLIRSFVSDFIEATIVRDYRNLQTRESPYRFRGEIVAVGERLLEDEAVLATVAEGWVAGGIADEAEAARGAIITDLRDTVRTFAVIDDHVEEIETITHRIERRITNVVRFSDRMATVDTERLLATLGGFAASGLSGGTPVDVAQPLAIAAAPARCEPPLPADPETGRPGRTHRRGAAARPGPAALHRGGGCLPDARLGHAATARDLCEHGARPARRAGCRGFPGSVPRRVPAVRAPA